MRETPISFELEPPGEEELRDRIRATLEKMPWLVYEANGRVLGYAYASKFRPRPAYQWTAEVTIYVREDARGRGVARSLYTSLFARTELLLDEIGEVVAVVRRRNLALFNAQSRLEILADSVGYALTIKTFFLKLAEPTGREFAPF